MYESSDMYGPYIECLYCGYMLDLIPSGRQLDEDDIDTLLRSDKKARTETAQYVTVKTKKEGLTRKDFPPGAPGYQQWYYFAVKKHKRKSKKAS